MNENKIDHRINYILMLDTETANTIADGEHLDMSNVLVYDLGFAVIDKRGTVYESASFVNRDIFVYERELMQSAYYAEKIPQYVEDIRAGRRKMASYSEIRKAVFEVVEKYDIKVVCAHNSRFDVNAVNITQRYLTKSKYRYFLPYGLEVWDTMKMAQSVIFKQKSYREFCEKNGYLTKNNQCRKTAEVLYRYISGNNEFVESHTGLEDVMIEKEILAYCFRQHKAMEKVLYPAPLPKPIEEEDIYCFEDYLKYL